MAFTTAASGQSMCLGFLFGALPPSATQIQRATTRILGAGMAPNKKTVRRNVKRLRK